MNKTFSDYRIEIPPGRTGEVDTLCPECGPSRKKKNAKCLSVNVEKGAWVCHHCQWAGGLEKGVWSKSVPYVPESKVYEKPTYPVSQPLNDETIDFFKRRGIPVEILERNKIVSGHLWMPQLEEKTFVIQFPYYRDGELVNVKYRALEKKAFMMAKGAERIFFGLDDLRDPQEQDCVMIVEGEIDKLSCEVAGFLKVLSVPDGAPPKGSVNISGKMSYLDSASELLSLYRKCVIAVDGDGPGQTLQAELIRRIGPEKCFVVAWPEGCKDANDVLVKYGAEQLRKILQDARPVPVAGVLMAMDFEDEYFELISHGMRPGLSTGWPIVDVYYTVKPSQMTVVTGMPGDGKSTWVDALTVNLAENHGWRFGVFSPEFYPVPRHILSYAQQYLGKSFQGNHGHSREDAEHALRFIHDHFFFIGQDDSQLQTVDTLILQAVALVKRFGINGLVIDPWSEIDHSRDQGLSETEYISKALTKFRVFGRKFSVHVWIVAHPTKMQKNMDCVYPMPNLYDISGSAHWKNKSDNGLVIYRDRLQEDHAGLVTIGVQKIKFREVGKLGEFNMKFNLATGQYSSDCYSRGEF